VEKACGIGVCCTVRRRRGLAREGNIALLKRIFKYYSQIKLPFVVNNKIKMAMDCKSKSNI
jgi:thiamine monophosphate synthase